MRVIEADLMVTEKGKGIVILPPDVEPGEHKVTITIADEPTGTVQKHQEPIEFLVLDLGPWPEDLSLHREDMYDDWGR